MNIFLLSLVDKSIEAAMIRFSQLSAGSALLSTNHLEILARSAKKILETYISFFQSVNIAPNQYQYNEKQIVKSFDLTSSNNERSNLDRKLINLVSNEVKSSILPINVHIHSEGRLYLYAGIGAVDSMSNTVLFFLNELSLLDELIRYSPSYLRYLDNIVFNVELTRSKTVRELAGSLGINYNRFQRDCREYLRDTFHQFQNKLKMLNALEDILFSSYTLKEIAYKNNFSDYNNMYFLFHTRYHFSLQTIPRFFDQI
ncbi:helix-turn-helix transcriptional regulator [Pedobacter sp. ISL-68]|uniref:helix-turn-helix domain-containing protein n=1 Tax=unclassified Pedobacter TaxID=2628915 RepID=UPI001BEB96DF|nr:MULTISPECIES: AraC family transcriptional regulator [unclassified Pedobacter]MBT2559831.1 helix-turn-helix transcriptional regulator [Pedobacter sp. ISL-64]MBT2592136.1 helix-turn-helix transcriptional regulator [Pedobacter sp. ISL-68]